ncbi:hypothetical protein EJB05_26995, partial [Eragrostis curvula]
MPASLHSSSPSEVRLISVFMLLNLLPRCLWANCYKWRVIPRKEKYEELRDCICQEHFVCQRANEWSRVLSCDDTEDMPPNGCMVWAIDLPNIAKPPPSWDREARPRVLPATAGH